jgi:hypothetical protein
LLNFVSSTLADPDVTIQYQRQFLQVHTWLKAAGWVVLQSSNGTDYTGDGGSGVVDNIASTADVVHGNGGAARSWVVYQSPAAFSVTPVELLLVAEDTALPTLPEQIKHQVSMGTFAAGTDTVNPVAPVSSTHPGVGSAFYNFLPQNATTKANTHMHMAYSDVGDFWIGGSKDGTQLCELFFCMFSPDRTLTVEQGGPDNANHAWGWAFHGVNSQEGAILNGDAPGFTYTIIAPVSGDMTSLVTTQAKFIGPAIGVSTDGWPGGVSSAGGKPFHIPMDMILNQTSLPQNSYRGRVVDVEWSHPSLAPNIVDDAEAANPVRGVSLGSLWVQVESVQLPMML